MYATYRKIESWNDVPPEGPLDAKVRESHRLDFKETADPKKGAEHAKDIATFANTFGGVILLGAKAERGTVAYPGISREHAANLVESYEQAAKDLCSPSPVTIPIIINIPSSPHVVLAVNVDPVIDGPVGSRAAKDQDVWSFPMREGSHTKCLRPNELPMYMNPQLRRTLLLIDCIKGGAPVSLWHQPPLQWTPPGHAALGSIPLEYLDAIMGDVDLTKNAVTFGLNPGRDTVRVPLNEIEAIWQDQSNRWNLRLAGRVEPTRAAEGGGVIRAHFLPVVR